MSKFFEMFQHGSTANILAGVGIVSLICAYLGVFVVLRRDAMAGVVLVHVSPFGMALALFLSGLMTTDAFMPVRLSPPFFALVLTIIAATLIALVHRGRRPRYKTPAAAAWLAVGALTVMLAASLALVGAASIVHAKAEMLYLLFGNRLSISPGQIVGLAVLAVIVALVHALFHKEFVFVSFDPDMAQALGVRPRLWNIVLFLTLGVTISIAIRAAGALAVFGLLVLPAATALLACRNLRLTFIVAVAVGAVCSLVGIAVSSMADLPTGPTIVGVSVVPVAIASLVRRQR